jgi:hypothetical protein
MTFQSSLVIRYSAYVWNGVCGMSLLHLDDPDRLGERERRQWLMLTAQLCGTGKRWQPLPDAHALLWQAAAWRDELRQLLHLLAEAADHRLHPLPWALPIPVRVHGCYSRAEMEAASCFAEALRLRSPARRRPLDPPRGGPRRGRDRAVSVSGVCAL